MIRRDSRGLFSLRAVRKGWRRRWRQWSDWTHMAVRLSPYIRKRKGRLGLALACGVGYTLTGLLEPWTMKLILDNVILGQPLPNVLARTFPPIAGNRFLLLNVMVGAIIALATARGLFYYYQKLLTARVGQQATAEIRLELYRHIQRLSLTFHNRRRTGDILARLTSDIRFLRDVFISLPLTIVSELMLIVGMIVVMFLMDWSLTLLALMVLPGLAVMLRAYQGPMRKAVRRQREREGDIATIASEVLGAIKVVQGFRREEYEADRFNVENKRSLRTGLKAARLEAKLRWSAEIAVAVVTALVIGVAARRVLAGSLTPGDIIVFVRYLKTFNRPLRRVSRMAERAARGATAAERVLEMMNLEPAVRDLPGARRAPRFEGQIVFDGVSLAHRRRQVLSDIDLRIEPGERVGIVGPTGAGKSSLIALIPRFYDPATGRVLIDGRDVREFKLATLRDQVSVVFQEPILFATSIAENIGYGNPSADEVDIVRAAERAGIDHVINSLPDGYDTVIGERGCTLSGGERQCVAIARAIIKDAPIVILDEPTAGLDSWSAALVVQAIRQLMDARTVIMISHDLRNLRDVERVIVIDGGRIVDEGSHEKLRARNGLYQTFSHLQAQELGR